MENLDQLSEQAQDEITEAKRFCEQRGYDEEFLSMLWNVIQRWIDTPGFADSCDQLNCTVLNELEFCLGNDSLRSHAWQIITELAAFSFRVKKKDLQEMLRCANFEVAAEPPEYAPTLELPFSLASHPETRWAVFSAYEYFPWRLRTHARKYSGGSITDDDCDEWLRAEGHREDEVLMKRD